MDAQVQATLVKVLGVVVAVGTMVLAFTVAKDQPELRTFLVGAATFLAGVVGVSRPGDAPRFPEPTPPSPAAPTVPPESGTVER